MVSNGYRKFFSVLKREGIICFFLLFSFSVYSQDKIYLLFVGDLMQHQAQIEAAYKGVAGYDYSACFQYVKEEISKADIAVGNLEVTMGGKPYKGYPAFSAPDEYLAAIKEAGFDVLLTANNHCLDTGNKGLQRTILMLDSLYISRAGTYMNEEDREKHYPLLIDKKGFRVALLNYTYGTNGISVKKPAIVNYIDKDVMLQDIQKARSMRPDVVIACIHWGIEYERLPNNEQKELANWLIANGVDHIIGSHPHVLQPLEKRKSSYSLKENVIVYSLGNYISNMSVRYTDGGMMFKMELSKRNDVVKITDCGYSLVWTSRPALSEKKDFIIYPAASPPVPLSTVEAVKLKTFVEDSRQLFQKYSVGIEEYKF